MEQQPAQAFMGRSTLFSNRDLASYHGGDVVQFDVLLVSNGMMPSSAESNFNININYTYELGHSANARANKATLCRHFNLFLRIAHEISHYFRPVYYDPNKVIQHAV